MLNPGCPSRSEAEQLLTWAQELNPGPWVDHSRTAARIAESIARRCGMDGDRAYTLGLLHDIGRYEGPRELHHVIAGHALMRDRGFDAPARICLTHSFSYPDLRAYCGSNDCSETETAFLLNALAETEMDDDDRLIQLADALGSVNGAVRLEIRLLDVFRRHGIPEMGREKIDASLALKAHFDRLAGMDIYRLFEEEIRANCFR